jgi:MFS family permease
MIEAENPVFRATEAPWPSAARAWWAVIAVTFAAFLSLMDRLVINLLVDPIKSDLHITETQFSFLQAASFAVVGTLLTVPFGLAADRASRRNLLVFGVAVWSLATAWGGFSKDYHQLLSARIFVGVGEAALWPVVVSLFADLLPPHRRGRAVGMVILAQILGSGASLSATGFILRAVAAGAFQTIPILGGLAAWRLVLVLCGVLGVAVILALGFVREPARRSPEAGSGDKVGLTIFAHHVWRNKALFIPLFIGAMLSTTSGSASAAWSPAIYIRRFHVTPQQIGPTLGLVAILAGIGGAFLGGFLSDRLETLKRPDLKLGVSMVALLCCLPGGALVWAPTPSVAMALQSSGMLFGPISSMVTIIALQDVIPAGSRGLAMSVLSLFTLLLGASIGPTAVALTTQYVFRDDQMVGYALQAISAPALIIGGVCFFLARREARRYFDSERLGAGRPGAQPSGAAGVASASPA